MGLINHIKSKVKEKKLEELKLLREREFLEREQHKKKELETDNETSKIQVQEFVNRLNFHRETFFAQITKKFEIDGRDYYIIRDVQGDWVDIYIVNSVIIFSGCIFNAGMAAGFPFVEYKIEKEFYSVYDNENIMTEIRNIRDDKAIKEYLDKVAPKKIMLNEIHTFNFQNKGLGKMLIEEVKSDAKKLGCSCIYGSLSYVDVKADLDTCYDYSVIQTSEQNIYIDNIKKIHRYNFYKNNNFEIVEDEYGNGYFRYDLDKNMLK